MAVHYTLSGRLLTMHLEGDYPPEDIITVFDEALADPALPAEARLLIDLRPSLHVAKSTTEELRLVAEAFPPRAQRVGGLCAIMVEGLLQYGLMRMASVFCQGPGIAVEIFTSRDEALQWLGIHVAAPAANPPPE